jgi:hypothetical protein
MQPMSDNMLIKQLNELNIPHTKMFAEHVWNSVIDNILLPEDYLKSPIVNGVKKQCAFGHPPLESHTELANKIFEKVKF